jgi:NitT/TauT family transport system permease protein
MGTDIVGMPGEAGPAPLAAAGRRRRRWVRNWQIWVLPTVVMLVILGAWELASRTSTVNPLILPPFTSVASALFDLAQTSYFWTAARVTAIETLIGFVAGSVLAFVFGSLIGMFRWARYSFYPPAVAVQITPRVALAPLFLTWFGFGMTSRIVMAASLCFFPVLLNVVVGMDTADEHAKTFMRSLGASKWQAYRKLYLPSTLALIFAGLKNAITLALIGVIVAEFVGGAQGLGVLVKTYNFQLDVANGFAVIIALMIFGLILYLAMEILDRKIIFWRTR